MDFKKLRAWWAHRQGLDGSLAGQTPAEVLRRSGWARSVGGCAPYLTLYSRAGISREQADQAVAALSIHELPSARGCTYVLPAEHFALGLKLAQSFAGADRKTALKLGVPEKELDRLAQAVVDALNTGPLGPDQLREALGGAVRNLGPEGVKKGLATTLPIALGELQVAGEIRRIPLNGRLDQQSYKYRRWSPNPLAAFRMSTEEANVEIARLYFSWIAPATLAEFQWFSGFGVKVAKAAVAPLDLVDVGDGRWMSAADRDALECFRVPVEPSYLLVSSLDGLALLRRNLASLLEPGDLETGQALAGLTDLPSHAIVDRGRIVGLWEFDTATSSIAWRSFRKADAALKDSVAETEAFVRDQLGDARAFSLDSPKSRVARIQALRG